MSLAAVVSVLMVTGVALALRPAAQTSMLEVTDRGSASAAGGAGSGAPAPARPGESVAPSAVAGPAAGDVSPDGEAGAVEAGVAGSRGGRAGPAASGTVPGLVAASGDGGATRGRQVPAAAPQAPVPNARSTAVAPPGPLTGASGHDGHDPGPAAPVGGEEGSGSPGTPIDIDFIEQFGGPPPDVFLAAVDERCVERGLRPGCVTVSLVPDRRDPSCKVVDSVPSVSGQKVKVGTHFTFEVRCNDGTNDLDDGADPSPGGGSP